MTEKPVSGDQEQRTRQTKVAREQSGLPPEQPTADNAEPDAQGSEKRTPAPGRKAPEKP